MKKNVITLVKLVSVICIILIIVIIINAIINTGLFRDISKQSEKISETEEVSFSELYGENGTITLKKMMSYLGVTTPNGDKVTIEKDGENTGL